MTCKLPRPFRGNGVWSPWSIKTMENNQSSTSMPLLQNWLDKISRQIMSHSAAHQVEVSKKTKYGPRFAACLRVHTRQIPLHTPSGHFPTELANRASYNTNPKRVIAFGGYTGGDGPEFLGRSSG